jgi:uncharacterized phiE125 gp8 family phage protein
MTMTLLTPPALEPVTLAELRQFLRLAGDSDDDLLTGLLKAARETLEAKTGLALINQTFRLHADGWPRSGILRIPKYPVRSVSAVAALLDDGTSVAIAGHDLHLSTRARPARLYLAERHRPAQSLCGLAVDFVAGFGETGNEVPDALRHALMTLVVHWYEMRGVDTQSYPRPFERAIELWRRVSL